VDPELDSHRLLAGDGAHAGAAEGMMSRPASRYGSAISS
jgi:hypothetical protein